MGCPRCQRGVPSSARFCPSCGAALSATAVASPPPSAGLQAALAAIARAAVQIAESSDALIFQTDGDGLRLVAKHGRMRTSRAVGERWPLGRGLVLGRAVVDGRAVHVRDLAVAARREFKAAAAIQRADRVRTALALPLRVDGQVIGGLLIRRAKVRPFTRRQIALLQALADQAATAIENARLREELARRDADLTAAVDQQTQTLEQQTASGAARADLARPRSALARRSRYFPLSFKSS
jgi:two-component system, NtrC family, sensor kinase